MRRSPEVAYRTDGRARIVLGSKPKRPYRVEWLDYRKGWLTWTTGLASLEQANEQLTGRDLSTWLAAAKMIDERFTFVEPEEK